MSMSPREADPIPSHDMHPSLYCLPCLGFHCTPDITGFFQVLPSRGPGNTEPRTKLLVHPWTSGSSTDLNSHWVRKRIAAWDSDLGSPVSSGNGHSDTYEGLLPAGTTTLVSVLGTTTTFTFKNSCPEALNRELQYPIGLLFRSFWRPASNTPARWLF